MYIQVKDSVAVLKKVIDLLFEKQKNCVFQINSLIIFLYNNQVQIYW